VISASICSNKTGGIGVSGHGSGGEGQAPGQLDAGADVGTQAGTGLHREGAAATPSIRTVCSRRSITTRRRTSPRAVPTRMARGARNTAGVVNRTPMLSGLEVSRWVCRTSSTSAAAAESHRTR